MNEKVKNFIDAEKSKERAFFEKERDELLISLGLVNESETIREYSDVYSYIYNKWDENVRKYYHEKLIPIKITDEEYEEIKKYSTMKSTEEIGLNEAEKTLNIINIIFLTINITIAIILVCVAINVISSYKSGGGYYFLISIILLLMTLFSWAYTKVVINISNNINKINNKLK